MWGRVDSPPVLGTCLGSLPRRVVSLPGLLSDGCVQIMEKGLQTVSGSHHEAVDRGWFHTPRFENALDRFAKGSNE